MDVGGRGARWTKRGWRKGETTEGGEEEEEGEEEEGAIGVVVCAGTEKGGRAGVGWNTPEDRKGGEDSREGEGWVGGEPGTRILPKHPRNPGGRFK